MDRPDQTDIAEEIRKAELKKLDAEAYKLALETEEIERRLKIKWWKGQKFTQYFVAILVSSALLFGWARGYLDPILQHEKTINDLKEKRNLINNELLAATNQRLNEKKQLIEAKLEQIAKERDQLSENRKQLEVEIESLQTESTKLKEQKTVLGQIVESLKVTVKKMDTGEGKRFFSILNSDDAINKLSQFGWELWSDNYFGWLGYYLVIENKTVDPNLKVIVGREFEVEKQGQASPETLRDNINRLTSHPNGGALLILDYSYLGLANDDQALVGGVLYYDAGKAVEFYAPLNEWSSRLNAILMH